MRIGLITQWFPPERGTLVAEAIARGLADEGHTVEVVTGIPNYPTGKVLPGYQIRPYQREVLAPGVTVHRAPLWPNHDSSAVRRMVNYMSFAVGASAVVRTRVPTPDIWLVYSSPATAAIPALRLFRRHRRPVFLLIQDLWPDSVTGSGFVGGAANRGMSIALTAFCDATYRMASGIGVISPGMRGLLVDRGVPTDKIHDTPNWIDDSHLLPGHLPDPSLRNELGLPPGRLWMYAGNLGDLQGLDTLLDVFAATPDASLVLLGEGVARPRLERRLQEMRAQNIQILPAVPTADVGRYIAASDIQIVTLQDTSLLRVTMPSKMQTSLAAGKPVFVHAAGDAAQVVLQAGCGWVVTPGNIDQGVRATKAGLEATDAELAAMGAVGRRLFEQTFSTSVGPRRLSDAITAAREA